MDRYPGNTWRIGKQGAVSDRRATPQAFRKGGRGQQDIARDEFFGPTAGGGTLSAAVNQAVETDTAQTFARVKLRLVAQASEADTAQAVARIKGKAVAQVSETGSALAIGKVKLRIVGAADETDEAQSIAGGNVSAGAGDHGYHQINYRRRRGR